MVSDTECPKFLSTKFLLGAYCVCVGRVSAKTTVQANAKSQR